MSGRTSYCHIDDKAEAIPVGAHRVCGECGHVYPRAEDVEAEAAATLGMADYPTFCPLCLHDWLD